MKKQLELKLEIKFILDCEESEKDKVKEKLDDFGWNVLQDAKLTKEIKAFPGTIETAYDVVVTEL